MFVVCIVCGTSTWDWLRVFGSGMGLVALCGASCSDVFLQDPSKYEMPAEAQRREARRHRQNGCCA